MSNSSNHSEHEKFQMEHYKAVMKHWESLTSTESFILQELDFGESKFDIDTLYYSKRDKLEYQEAFDNLQNLGWIKYTKTPVRYWLFFKYYKFEAELTEKGLNHLRFVIEAISKVTGKKVIPNTKSYVPLTDEERNFMADEYIKEFYSGTMSHYMKNN